MLWTIVAILLALWLIGLFTNVLLGGFIHVLLIVALVVIVVQLFTGRRVVT